MSNIEFVRFTPVKDDKFLGIAAVKLYGKIILRYKVVPTKDGHGYFSTEANYKIDSTGEARQDYVPAFVLDSNFEIQEIRDLIHMKVKEYFSKSTPSHLASNTVHQNGFNDPTPPNGRISVPDSNERLPF